MSNSNKGSKSDKIIIENRRINDSAEVVAKAPKQVPQSKPIQSPIVIKKNK